MPLLEVRGLGVAYGDIQVLWDASITVEPGETVALLGPNGSGKSTLMNAVSGLRRIAAGEIYFDGQPLHKLPAHKIPHTGLSHVLERYRLFPQMTVMENLQLGAVSGPPRENLDAAFERVYTLFPRLKERRRQLAGSMSGGEQQMCAIGRGIMARPKLLMIDELSLGLAPRLVDRLGEALIEINRTGLTILLVEQDVLTAFEIARHAYVIETGRVSMSGATGDLGEDPRIREAYMGL